MASTAVHIANMREAIESGEVPGKFTSGRTLFTFPQLEYTNARGANQQWTIMVRLLHNEKYIAINQSYLDSPVPELDEYVAEITVKALQDGGKIREIVPTYVCDGKNIGKKNATNCITQALRDALGLYNKQVKRYGPADLDMRPPPMLVKKLGDSREAVLTPASFKTGITVQRKLNGVHFVMYKADDDIIGYSRTGAQYPGQVQIASEMQAMFTNAVGSPYFDGELYVHGKTLNWISGQARRDDDDGNLEFHIFDVFFPDNTSIISRDRQLYLDTFFAASVGIAHPHIKRVENFPVRSSIEMNSLAKQFLGEKYEGAIARKDIAGYRYGYNNYHSANLLKIKPKFDSEFPVVDYTQGTRGKDVGAVIWICEVPNPIDPRDTLFNVVPKDMTLEERYAIFKCLGVKIDGKSRFERDVKGLPLTIEYNELSTITGKPLQAKALAFRTYEAGPDPIKALLRDCLPQQPTP